MTFNHVGSETMKELFNQITGEKGVNNIITNEAMIAFYQSRVSDLGAQADELEVKQKELEEEIQKEIQNIFITKGAALLSSKQLYRVICKELGACEVKLEELVKGQE